MKHFLSSLFPQSFKNYYHLMCAVFAAFFFGFPAKNIRVIGVTGTNGKTTTSQFIAKVLEEAGYVVALASTINFQIGSKHWVNESKFTTSSAWKLQKFLREAVQAGCDVVVLETSSHALDQHRTFGIPYEIAVITNVTREHLDYHKTMEAYRAAKQKLFKKAKVAIINADMQKPEEFVFPFHEAVVQYSTKNKEADIYARGVSLDFKKVEWFTAETHFVLHLPGIFNIENALAALAVAQVLHIDFSVARKALEKITGIPGRMELVENASGIDIVIDYAVTPDAFEKLYASVLPLKIPGTQIIHVFGACGERDRGKREEMGEIASRSSDIVILTNEDPYHEDPEQIIDEIEKGVSKKKEKDYFRIFDRRQAIHKALEMAEQGDIVLVTGKGAETSMAFGDKRVPWNERAVIQEELAILNK
ncbi:MAG: UDP-N-acetylmuramoyl-L-alanyl-D-glutamate--2,6-diaminopimelate ligase [Patescibacteria group bacterium]